MITGRARVHTYSSRPLRYAKAKAGVVVNNERQRPNAGGTIAKFKANEYSVSCF